MEAAKTQEEADFGHTRPAKKTGTKKEVEQHGSRTASTSSSTNTRDSVCVPSVTSSTVYCVQRKFDFSYSVTRSANLAKQGSKRYIYRASDTRPAVSGARKPLPIKLGSNYPRRVGVTNNNRLQDRIPAEVMSTQEASSDCQEKECMQAEFQSMRDKQAISEIRENPEGFVSQMFIVPKKGWQTEACDKPKKAQPVRTEHFKMEGIHMLKDLLRVGDWMAKIDLKDAYFMVPKTKEDRDFLKFQWEDKFYQFNCLPFRLSSAPWVFTKTTWPVMAGVGTASTSTTSSSWRRQRLS